MKTLIRNYKGVEIVCKRYANAVDSDYYYTMYRFSVGGKFNVTHRLKDAKARIDRKLKEVV